MKNIFANFVDGIGNTPLIKLRGPSEKTNCNIYGKAEFLNPGGSVKDRAAWAMIKEAEEKKLISKGGMVVEGTAGNTGIGLTLIGNSRGYKTVIVMPETQTQEKKDTLKSIGADLRLVPAKPYKDPNNYVKFSGKLAEELKKENSKGVFWANQFDNIANYKGHYETTGQEIWSQTEGKIDAFICSSGTGGTIAGVGTALKEKNKNIRIVLSDPKGSSLYNHIKNGELKSEGNSITEGIGSSRVTKNFEQAPIDDAYSINDNDALSVLFELLEKEGLNLGTSSGINIVGAIKLVDVLEQLKIGNVNSHKADYGKLPDLNKVNFNNDVIFVWNGTTSGVCVPDAKWIPDNREGLTICDATSAVFATDIDFNKLDVITWSWQKVLGGEAAHGMLALSPRAIKRLETYTPQWPIPKLFRISNNKKLIKGIFEGSTINTPSMICVEDVLDSLNWVESIGGTDELKKISNKNLQIVTDWVNNSDWIEFMCSEPKIRSSTSITLQIKDEWFNKFSEDEQKDLIKKIVSQLYEENVVHDINGYPKAPPSLRLWGGPTVKNDDMKMLLPWIDWAYKNVKN
jgi:cysteine synthase A